MKVIFGKEGVENEAGRPTIVEISRIYLKKLSARGITVRLYETTTTEEGSKERIADGKVQEVSLPKDDQVFINNLEVKGLRITLGKDSTTFSSLDDDASITTGKSDLGGIKYRERSSRGAVLKALAIHSGTFNKLTLEALGRNGREYTPKQFLQFFGRTRLHGAKISGSYSDGKTSGTIGIQGQRNIPLSIDYIEPEGEKGYYKIRLPLKRIKVPALKLEKSPHTVVIPKPKYKKYTTYLEDVDVKLRAYIDDSGPAGKILYDVYLDSLDIAQLSVFGLEYHNSEKGIDVVFSPDKPLHIPNVKAGGFRFSSWKAFDVFGKEGGWLKAAAEKDEIISAHFESIAAELTDGTFLAENDKATGRSAPGC